MVSYHHLPTLGKWSRTAIRKSMDALSVIAEAAATEAIQPPAKRPHGHQSSRHAFQELARGSRPPLVEFNEDLWLGRDRYGEEAGPMRGPARPEAAEYAPAAAGPRMLAINSRSDAASMTYPIETAAIGPPKLHIWRSRDRI